MMICTRSIVLGIFLDIVKFEDHFEYPNFSVDLLDMDDPIQKSKIDYKIKYMNKFYQSGYIKGEKNFYAI